MSLQPVDPDFGQRPVLPLDGGNDDGEPTDAERYLQSVRDEALAMKRVFRARPASDGDGSDAAESAIAARTDARERVSRRPQPPHEPALDYDYGVDLRAPRAAAERLANTTLPAASLAELITAARLAARRLAPVSPPPCNARAAWKDYMHAHEPIALDHSTSFILLQYLTKWLPQRRPARLAEWTWALGLRLPDVLTGDELAVLRDVVRASRTEVDTEHDDPADRAAALALLDAFSHIVIYTFGQADLK